MCIRDRELSVRERSVVVHVAVAGLFLVGVVMCAAIVEPVGIVLYVSYAGLGSYVAIRRPDNSIGWLLMIAGWGFASAAARVTVPPAELSSGAIGPLASASVWLQGCGWAIASAALLAIMIVFPTGRMPIGGGRWLARLALAATVGLTALVAFAPTLNVTPLAGAPVDVRNPLAVVPDSALWTIVPSSTMLYATLLAIFIGGMVSLFIRFRRSSGLERLQFRWLVAGIAVVVGGTLGWVVLTLVVEAYGAALVVYSLSYPAIPLAVMIAVLRYRLFEIDRIISRTLAYAIVTATLAVVFITGVIGLQTLLEQLVGGNTIAVAGSTLLVAAMFQPLRRRVQSVVDRRFNRARYDARLTVDAFAGRLRDETDLGALEADLRAVVDRALEPRDVRIWVRDGVQS